MTTGEDGEVLREKIARAICEASGEEWKVGTYEVMSGPNFEMEDHPLDPFNNHWRHKADAVLALIGPVMDGGRECFGLLDEMDTLSRSGESKYGTGELMLRVGNALDKHRAARRPLRSQTAGEP